MEATQIRFHVEQQHSGSEDGPLWYVVRDEDDARIVGGYIEMDSAQDVADELNRGELAVVQLDDGTFSLRDSDAMIEQLDAATDGDDVALYVDWLGPGHYRSDLYAVRMYGDASRTKLFGPATRAECDAYIAAIVATRAECEREPAPTGEQLVEVIEVIEPTEDDYSHDDDYDVVHEARFLGGGNPHTLDRPFASFAVYRTSSFDGTVVTKWNSNDQLVGWAIPGASEYVAHDLDKVLAYIASGHYYRATRDYVAALIVDCPELFA